MSTQNLVSATLAPETKTEVLLKLSEIRTKLSFLVTLQPDEIKGLYKAHNTYSPFVEKAYNAIAAHPQIMAGVFDAEEFKKDYALIKEFTTVANTLSQLAESANLTLLAANSDAMNGALEVYAAVKQNRDKVPGLNVVADEMSEFFKKPKRKNVTAAK